MPVLRRLRSLVREEFRSRALIREWTATCASLPAAAAGGDGTLVVTGDTRAPVGSKGDEAMLRSIAANHPAGAPLDIATYDDAPAAAVADLGYRAVSGWANPWSMRWMVEQIRRHKRVIAMGADVMDGYYSTVTSLRLWMLADLAARMGRSGVVLGFSLNECPTRAVRRFLPLLHRDVRVCVRDPVTAGRFARLAGRDGVLVADSAFLMPPRAMTPRLQAVADWAAAQRAAGRLVLGFNIHPMLFPEGPARVARVVEAATAALAGLLRRRPVAVLAIRHDFRGEGLGDDAMLRPITDAVAAVDRDRVLYPQGHEAADEMKTLAGMCDQMVSGRMHLGIAALGQGVPLAGFPYQGKFEGLFAHFVLPASALFPPADCGDAARLEAFLERVVADQPAAQAQVRAALPRVLELSRLNYGGA